MNDQDILEALERKDFTAAAELLAEAYGSRVGRLCMALLGSQSEATAALRETMLAALSGADGLTGKASLDLRLLATARRRTASILQGRPRADGAEPSSPAASARRLLAGVRPSEREALVLRYVAGLDTPGVGFACGIDESAAQSRLSRGLVKLREQSRAAEAAKCDRIDGQLASVLSGGAPPELLAHIADCDACRDARYDAEQAERAIRDAGSDFEVPEGFAHELTRAATAAILPDPAPASPQARSRFQGVAKRWAIPVLAAAVGAVALISSAHGPSTSADDPLLVGPPWRGKVAKVLTRAGKLEICAPGGSACHPARAGDDIPAGSELRTDRSTLAELAFTDGSNISLDRESTFRLSTRGRGGELRRGGLVADVQPQADSSARF
ncbi:MAG TPA: sigma factor-like helix-turn-helix DNA-binding protein, partial [Polyangiaceae bacterium]|nr:sigma factor-like helix-turn-helix DNA-binding protein [Polyangiaceae bacterium]